MAIDDPAAFYNALLKAIKESDLTYLEKVYHPDFQGYDREKYTSLDYVFKKILYRATRYNNRYFRLLGSLKISDNTYNFLEYFYGYDTALEKPSEMFTSVTFEFKDNKIYREWLIPTPYEKDPKKSFKDHDITIERQQRCKLMSLLNNLSIDTGEVFNLTNKEIDCLYGYLSGASYKAVGKSLHISEKTVETHLRNIKQKFKVGNVKELKRLFQLV